MEYMNSFNIGSNHKELLSRMNIFERHGCAPHNTLAVGLSLIFFFAYYAFEQKAQNYAHYAQVMPTILVH